jgi:hypothetical protein
MSSGWAAGAVPVRAKDGHPDRYRALPIHIRHPAADTKTSFRVKDLLSRLVVGHMTDVRTLGNYVM